MKYFYDTEFHEDGKTIDLISIGIVANDGREYYAVNKDAYWGRIVQHDWLMENVVPQLLPEAQWKPKAQIRDEVAAFLLAAGQPELWAWYSAYDHVVLAQLFGTMLDLPDGIPMYTHDLRAYLDYVNVDAIPAQPGGQHDALQDARHVKTVHDYAKKQVRP